VKEKKKGIHLDEAMRREDKADRAAHVEAALHGRHVEVVRRHGHTWRVR
jgi:hypothetical protein